MALNQTVEPAGNVSCLLHPLVRYTRPLADVAQINEIGALYTQNCSGHRNPGLNIFAPSYYEASTPLNIGGSFRYNIPRTERRLSQNVACQYAGSTLERRVFKTPLSTGNISEVSI